MGTKPVRFIRAFMRGLWTFLLLAALAFVATPVSAEPALMLDAIGGNYVGGSVDATVVSTDVFTLVALLNPANGDAPPSNDTFTVDVALVPMTATATNLGSFMFNGYTVQVTSDMTYGNPGLPPHGVYDTYYAPFSFTFNLTSSGRAELYNPESAANPHVGPIPFATGSVFYQLFTINLSNLSPNVAVWFDLYDAIAGVNAPFSEGVTTTFLREVPEPNTMVLTGLSLLLLAVIRRRRQAGPAAVHDSLSS